MPTDLSHHFKISISTSPIDGGLDPKYIGDETSLIPY